MRAANRRKFAQFRQVQRIIFSVRNNALAALARRARYARAKPFGLSGVRLIHYNPMLAVVIKIQLARHIAGSQIRSPAHPAARPPRFARWRACASSLSLGWLHFAGALARTGNLLRAARGGLSFPAAWLWPCQASRTVCPHLSAGLPSASNTASACHSQHTDFAVRTSHTFCTSPPQDPHIKPTTIPDGQSVTSLSVMAS